MASKKSPKRRSAAVLPDRFTTTPTSPFAAGTTVQVCFTNPSLANQRVTVSVVSVAGEQHSLNIALDGEGHGCTSWVAPAWDGGTFEHSTSADHPFVIT